MTTVPELSDRELKRQISRAYDFTEAPLCRLLKKLDPKFEIVDWHPYRLHPELTWALPVSTVIYNLSLEHAGQAYKAQAVVSRAPYDHGCGKLLLFLRADDGEDLLVCLERTMPGNRSFQGRYSRWMARRLGMIAAVADRLTLDNDSLADVRAQLDQLCAEVSERNRHYAADVEAEELAAVTVRPGKRQRPSALSASR